MSIHGPTAGVADPKRVFASQHEEEDHAARPAVNFGAVVRLKREDFWRDVGRWADTGLGCFPKPELLREPKICNHQPLASAVKQKVLKLEVAVADPALVAVRGPGEQLVRVECAAFLVRVKLIGHL